MKLIKSIIYSFALVAFCQISVSHAENIDFQGHIAEFSCTENSNHKDCNNIQAAISHIKEMSSLDNEPPFLKNNKNDIAAIKVENMKDQSHKILVINYY
ncbi:hypothetical protein [Acinetobacter bouvetii]|uniref:Type 1 fimbrial protein n=1 Tax=Acinetobacter bouvetii TaxID=202951 RepID=A0A811GHX8_9GAMM|nr:hypothetical protein [Acinetobacter bouvetii]CAB1213705.1 hypothetical protein SFB21_1352 [Acinetobacter bouvetii]